LAERTTCDWKCVVCKLERFMRKYRGNPEFKARVIANASKSSAAANETRQARKRERNAAYQRERRQKGLNGEQVATWRAAKMQRVPPWADLEKIRDVYRLAQRVQRQKGVKVDVDHIIPLRGKLVSGLHVHENLQLLTRSANRRKQKKFPCLTAASDRP